MRNIRMSIVLATLLSIAATAGADPGAAGGGAAVTASGSTPGTEVTASTTTAANATAPDTRRDVEAIRAKGQAVAKAARARADARLRQVAGRVDAAAERGERRVAERLANEFGTTAQVMMDEKAQLRCGWGELMIAHTLAANSTANVGVASLFDLHRDGMGWGQIAGGMGLELGGAVRAAQAEGRVAQGQAVADGKVAVARGEGSKLGAGVNANGATGAGAHGVHAGLGAGAGASAGVPAVRIGR